MHFDIVFLDVTSPTYYDRMTLEKGMMGGTEATVTRVAEGLGSLGLKVAVVQGRCAEFEPIMGQHAFFMHAKDLGNMTCNHYVQLRINNNPDYFPKAKKYIWLHDLTSKTEAEWLPSFEKNKTTVIGVSRWHRNQIRENIGDYERLTYIYNPVVEELYTADPDFKGYNPNLLIWPSSPHKGLAKALELLKRLRAVNPKFNLIVFNPGYLAIDSARVSVQPGVTVYGPVSCQPMWRIIKGALCSFYPTQWDETFGMVAAEANAMGTPMATFKRAALKEVISSENQFAKDDDDMVRMVLDWNQTGRPIVNGRDEFRFNNVIMDWVKLLAKGGM